MITACLFQRKRTDLTIRVNHILTRYLNTLIPSTLSEAIKYSLLGGGKRIRPLLVYATGEIFNVATEVLDVPAAAIEMMHTYSLIHDDLPAMDNDRLRRGRLTCHVYYDEATAILAGDALQAFSVQLLTDAPFLSNSCKLALINELTGASGANGMCVGQLFDIEAENKIITAPELGKIHHYKTGLLIRAAIRFGALCAGDAAAPYRAYLDQYAHAIGLAFQIQDDILNVIGDQTEMGKPNGSDQALEKSTYPALLGLDEAIATTHILYKQALDALNQLPYSSDTLQALAHFIIQRNN